MVILLRWVFLMLGNPVQADVELDAFLDADRKRALRDETDPTIVPGGAASSCSRGNPVQGYLAHKKKKKTVGTL